MGYFDSLLARADVVEPMARAVDQLRGAAVAELDEEVDTRPTALREGPEPEAPVRSAAHPVEPSNPDRVRDVNADTATGTETAPSPVRKPVQHAAPDPDVSPHVEPHESSPAGEAVHAPQPSPRSEPQPAESIVHDEDRPETPVVHETHVVNIIEPRPAVPEPTPRPVSPPVQVVMPVPATPDVVERPMAETGSAPNVSISIGRIVVQTPTPKSVPKPARVDQSSGSRTDSLADYLKRRRP